MAEKVIVGLSGGVDSSVSAYMLLQQGYELEAVFMKNWEEDDQQAHCTAQEDLNDAQKVCDKLGIVLHTINFAAEYYDEVFEHFLSEYRANRTPNPDILCNKHIKFHYFLQYAKSLGADKIATGHYCRLKNFKDHVALYKGLDPNKDQSYFLCALSQDQLKDVLFPIGELEKPKVREIAKAQGLINHNKKDSTGICFIGPRHFKDFLARYIPAQPGDIISESGQVIGQHQGLMYYTLGQRQGLGIGGVKNYPDAPWYVAQKIVEKNQLLCVQQEQHPLLHSKQLKACDMNWITPPPEKSFSALAKTRYRQQDQD